MENDELIAMLREAHDSAQADIQIALSLFNVGFNQNGN